MQGLDRKRSRLVIRADASVEMGTGHIMRCIALGQAWKKTGRDVVFIAYCDSPMLSERLSKEGFEAILLDKLTTEWKDMAPILASYPRDWVVLDGYHLNTDLQRAIKEAGHKILVIDDMAHMKYYIADIILNQNLNAEEFNYRCNHDTKLLLGTKYVLLRDEFLEWRKHKRTFSATDNRVLVTMGGSDPDNTTLAVLHALEKAGELNISVVVGPSNPYLKTLQEYIALSKQKIILHVNPPNIAELMAQSDLAVSAAGSTCWELAFMGVPTGMLIVAENQNGIASALQQQGAVLFAERAQDFSEGDINMRLRGAFANDLMRLHISRRMRQLVDGEGRVRVTRRLSVHFSPKEHRQCA